MSHRRAPLPAHYSKAPKGTCRWCNEPVLTQKGEPTKGTWHPACVEAFKLIHWPAVTRAAVLERDKGICARCGRDCQAWAHALRAEERAHMGLHTWLMNREEERLFGAVGRAPYRWRREQWSAWRRARGWLSSGSSAWQHDHIRPLIEANKDISFWQLDNIQTLCHPCHVAKGVEDNARRRKARDPQGSLAL